MRLLLDQGMPRDGAALLRRLNHDCMRAGEIGMSKAADDEILAWCLEHRAVAVTLDANFHALLAVFRGERTLVIRVRIEGLGSIEW